MKIKWKQNIYLPHIRYIARPVNIPMATLNPEISVQEYEKERLSRKGITIEEDREGEISRILWSFYILLGYSDESIVRNYFKLDYYPLDIKRFIN